jgi:putative ABC transport system permease protein
MPQLRSGRILRIAMRNVLRFRLQTVLIAIAALSGTGGVIASTGYAAGGREIIISQFSRLGAKLLIITPLESRSTGGRARTGSLVTTLNESDYKAILQSVNGISGSSPTVAAVLRIRAGDLTKSVMVVGCDSDYFQIKNWSVVSGELFDSAADHRQVRVVLLGITVARDLFGIDDPTGRQVMINRIPFAVGGILAERGQGLDAANEDDQVYVPLHTAMHRLLDIDYFNSILFENENGTHLNTAEREITAILEQRHRHLAPGRRDFQVQNQKRLIDAQLAAFGRLTFLIQWVAASTLAVSSLGVLAVTWIGVRNRTREIGTRRAIGATRSDILVQFVAEGTMCALTGSVAGVVIGFLALQMIDARVKQPFEFSAVAVTSDLLASTALYLVFTLIAGFRATGIQPSVALGAE